MKPIFAAVHISQVLNISNVTFKAGTFRLYNNTTWHVFFQKSKTLIGDGKHRIRTCKSAQKRPYNHRDRNEIKTKSEQLNIRFSNTYRQYILCNVY